MKLFLVPVIKVRLALLARQRLFWMTLLAGFLGSMICAFFARVSFIDPIKIYWDLILGWIFVLQIWMCGHLACRLMADERSRRTLEITLSAGVSRAQWIASHLAGVVLGLWMSLFALSVLASLIAVLFGFWPALHMLSSLFVSAMEIPIVVTGAWLVSLFVRPLLGEIFVFSLVAILHSVTAMESVIASPEMAIAWNPQSLKWILNALKILPPLEWFDWRVFVGTAESISSSAFLPVIALSIGWSSLILYLGIRRFQKMDL